MYMQVSHAANGPCPAIIVPHGGPHTALAVNYYMPFSFLTALGYCVIAVNYRGSTGFGEAGVQSLPGHAGHYDVEDCVAALDAAVAAGGWCSLFCVEMQRQPKSVIPHALPLSACPLPSSVDMLAFAIL